MVLAHGLSLVRPELRVEMTALMGSDGGADLNAALMSAALRGVPVRIERLGCRARESGLRTSAVTLWLRERASVIMSLPVRPEAPRRRTRI